jgi:hypothetical protein
VQVTEYMLTALRDQGVSHFFIDLGGLNDSFGGGPGILNPNRGVGS